MTYAMAFGDTPALRRSHAGARLEPLAGSIVSSGKRDGSRERAGEWLSVSART